VVIWRRAFQDSIEKDPGVGIRLTIKQGGYVLHAEDKYSTTWYSDMTCKTLVTGDMQFGWRYWAVSLSADLEESTELAIQPRQ